MVANPDNHALDTRTMRQAARAATHGGVGALLALGLCSELFTAAQAHADIVDSILFAAPVAYLCWFLGMK